eukprot:8254933-Pyramimonas_sp.AAC.1
MSKPAFFMTLQPVWGMAQAYTKSAPHKGYDLLAKWGARMPGGFFSVTSNIDGHWVRTPGVKPEQVRTPMFD